VELHLDAVVALGGEGFVLQAHHAGGEQVGRGGRAHGARQHGAAAGTAWNWLR
jgi:hypothetical protein